MPGHDIIVIGASAGGVEALVKLVGQFPADLPASIFMVLHIPAQSPSGAIGAGSSEIAGLRISERDQSRAAPGFGL